MLSCAWAVTNGGNTMMEMMYLGKAVHIIPQTDAENNLAQLILRDNGILGIGKDQLRIPKLNKVIDIGKRAGGLIDGQGVNRIIRIINKYL
jgi:hypothetical protein